MQRTGLGALPIARDSQKHLRDPFWWSAYKSSTLKEAGGGLYTLEERGKKEKKTYTFRLE